MANLMKCINNTDYEDCMTIGNVYDVEVEEMENGAKMHKFLDDNGDFLQSMLPRFETLN